MKKLICLLLTAVLLLSVIPAAFAEEEGEILESGTKTLLSARNDESYIFEWTAPSAGTVIVTSTKAAFKHYVGGIESLLYTSGSCEFEVQKDDAVSIEFWCYYRWGNQNGEITYEIRFVPSEGAGDGNDNVIMEEYAVSDQVLVVGENTVTLETNAYTTIYGFAPGEAGIYEISAQEGILLGYWGGGTFFLMDQTADKTNTLSVELTNPDQAAMIGVTNTEPTTLTITIEKTGTSGEVEIPLYTYENKNINANTPVFAIPEGFQAGAYVDVYSETPHTAVLGDDGYYHLDSADGDILMIDMDYLTVLTDALNEGRGIMYAYVVEDGVIVAKYDIATAVQAYEALCDENGYYPLTEDLIFFYQVYADGNGVPSFVLEEGYNEESGWMFACLTMIEVETEPEVTEPEVTEPEVTEPEVTEPEVTEPEVTEPEVTEPEVTEPEVTEPEVTEPEVTEPEATEPEVTEPEVTEPEVTEPEVTEPEVTEPEVTEPEVTEPEVTEPEVTEPEVTEPEVTEPEVTEPEVTEPEVTEPEVTEPEVTEPEVTEPEVTEPEATEPEATEPEDSDPGLGADKVTNPTTNAAYKFGFHQANLDQTLYFAGAMDGYYLATTTDLEEAVDVYLENVEGGLRIYFMSGGTKTYIDIVLREGYTDKVNVVLTTEPTCTFSYDTTYGTFVTTVAGQNWYLGTYNSYNTISASNTSYIEDTSKIGVSQFPVGCYTVKEAPKTGDVSFVAAAIAGMVSLLTIAAMPAARKKLF